MIFWLSFIRWLPCLATCHFIGDNSEDFGVGLLLWTKKNNIAHNDQMYSKVHQIPSCHQLSSLVEIQNIIPVIKYTKYLLFAISLFPGR